MRIMTFAALTAAAAISGCVEDSGSSGVPSAAEQACLQRVTQETSNRDVILLSSSYSEAGTEVIAGVGPQRARWQCIAYRDGSTSRPLSLTDEGAL